MSLPETTASLSNEDLAKQTIDRIKRAARRVSGCRLTPDMVQALDVTIFAEWGVANVGS